MTVRTLSALDALRGLGDFSAVIDARSEGEFAIDHLPGAINWPSLDDDERKLVGTDYKKAGGFEAKKIGAALVARNVAEHIEREVKNKPPDWKPLVYCWRGGKRSGTLAWFLDQIGFETTSLQGGYKAFRAAMVEDLSVLPHKLSFRVICGKTGTGKTRLISALQKHGAQVLDLEALAEHRGSVLGLLPGIAQPSQKMFDSRVWSVLRTFDRSKPIWVESESKKVGNVQVPPELMARIRQHGKCWSIELPDADRVALLLEEYDFFVRDPEYFCKRIEALVALCGRATVDNWQQQARAGAFGSVFADLMVRHYDPAYSGSMARNFAGYGQAAILAPANHSTIEFERIAQALCSISVDI